MAGYDVVVVGGGSAGCVLAARLSEDPDRSVCLIEGGPDYGPYAEGRWPEDLLNAHQLAAVSHDRGAAGNPGWSHTALEPYRRRYEQALRVRPSRVEDLEPLERAGLGWRGP